jgi:hypothetical protein
MRKLILHPGWSKTGTSAIQKALFNHSEELLAHGFHYPKACQWGDHSHHHFALAFTNNPVHKSAHSTAEAVDLMAEEINLVGSQNIIISSELSPLYFRNQEFDRFLKLANITEVEVVFTVREQGSLAISMFNQLIKDPQVRSKHSFFETYVRISGWMNFEINIRQWSNFFGEDSIKVVPYSDSVVVDFLNALGIDIDYKHDTSKGVNTSLPNEILECVRTELLNVNDAGEYKRILNSMASQYAQNEFVDSGSELLSERERQAIFQYYLAPNNLLAKKYLKRDFLFKRENLKAIKNHGFSTKLS